MTNIERAMDNCRNHIIGKLWLSRYLMPMLLVAVSFTCFGQAPTKPTIGGAVFGGGRMAAVAENTDVKVYKCNTIGAVYGGNDVASTVGGVNGATITIGTSGSTENIVIGSVYGGGNGFYDYQYQIDGSTSFVEGLNQPNSFTGTVYTRVPAGSTAELVATFNTSAQIPSIQKSSITINSSGAKIDSVFGGARNALVTNSATIVVNNGTIKTVFGGNNFGGTISGNISISVVGTTTDFTPANAAVGLGTNHGIGMLFGGGNKVPAGAVAINITGGQIETAFAGGNSATVTTSTTLTMDISGSSAPTAYSASNTVFDVWNIFGGNNLADMGILPTLQLKAGYVKTVYGGGNEGSMTADYIAAVGTLGANIHKSTFVNVNDPNIIIDHLYGGCMMANVSHNTFVNINNGHTGVVYGGCNVSGIVTDSSYVYLKGGTIHDYVFGGSNGDYGCNDGTVYTTSTSYTTTGNYMGTAIPNITHTYVRMEGSATVAGNLYGGGNKAPVGSVVGNDGVATVMLISGTVNGSVFGGGRMASINGYTNLNVNGPIEINKIYGGNDISGNVSGANRPATPLALDNTDLSHSAGTYMLIQGSPTIGSVYGGGNGDYTPETYSDLFHNCTTQPADVLRPHQESSYVDIDMSASGKITRVFGGGDLARVGDAKVYITNEGTVDTAFGGGNRASVTDSAVVIVNATAPEIVGNYNVKALFGGNNAADMAIVPNVVLTKGRIHTVYGGGNAGGMTGDKFLAEIPHLSTFVNINNNDVTVSYGVYGGCRMADVAHGTYVKVNKGNVANLFGGNDVSGVINGETHVIVAETGKVAQLYGGSNGHYIYNVGSVKTLDNLITITTSTLTRPLCDSTNVQLIGGEVTYNIYGGGLAGDCNYTNVNVEGTCKVAGIIFGGGCGEVASIGACVDHLGNVNNLATTNIRSMSSESTCKTIYGGGHAGDVANTDLTLHNTVTHSFTSLYGGCYAANISGTAKTAIYGNTDNANRITVDTVYGGNNFAGTIDSTWLTVKTGRYYNIYGGGNGDYNYHSLCDSLPFNNVIRIDLGDSTATNDELLTVLGNAYGGGNKGVVGKDLNANGESGYREVSQGEYGQIVTNIYSGNYRKHVFAGARGRDEKTQTVYGRHQLVFGIKILNMYDGYIHQSLYGGSEFIDDGYPWECKGAYPHSVANDNAHPADSLTTLRPSSIVNIMGGIVRKRVYGAGYLGTVYGSAYVNVGVKAIDSCMAFRRNYSYTNTGTYSGVSSSYNYNYNYASLKPIRTIHDNLNLLTSIYNGSDWGDAGANSVFNTRGFYGGESHIIVDGQGYNTSLSQAGSALKSMDINYSLIGAGTSCEGGDVSRKIIVRNYGDYTSCNVSKDLYSIQRADTVIMERSYLTLKGEQDAYTAYPSPDYSYDHIGLLIMRDKNIVMIESPAVNVGNIRSEDSLAHLDQEATPMSTLVQNNDLGCNTDNATLCDKLTSGMLVYNVLMMKNGVYFSVAVNNAYGAVLGYMYLLAQDETQSYVYARQKIFASGISQVNANDGGFVSICRDYNIDSVILKQLGYVNADHGLLYRTWTVGTLQGSRNRHITIVANANPSAMGTSNDSLIHQGYPELAVAHSSLQLPPSNGGHFYTVSNVLIDQDNGGQIKLVNSGWKGTNTTGELVSFTGSNATTETGKIIADPNYSFGMVMSTSQYFSTDCHSSNCDSYTVVAGNNNFSQMGGFVSTEVSSGVGMLPTMNFDLLYATTFNTTIIRDVVFMMKEWDEDSNYVGPVNVTVSIATVISRFSDMDLTMLAMYNEGTNNYYERKVVLPAAFERRLVKLKKVEWAPNMDATTGGSGNMFKVADTSHYHSNNALNTRNDVFAFSVSLTENVTDNIANTLGWYDIVTPSMDVFNESGSTGNTEITTTSGVDINKTIGTLDGRASAALNVTLHYNGDIFYRDYARVGTVKLHFAYTAENGGGDVPFVVTLNVKTRERGDTIYIASKARGLRLPGMGNGLEDTLHRCNDFVNRQFAGKRPDNYVVSFDEAFDVYEEGDVLCIIDTVKLSDDINNVIRGIDYSIVQVIRYSGSHKDAPGNYNAYRGPMVMLQGHSQLSLYNVWFNGSGLTKTRQKFNIGNGTFSYDTTLAAPIYKDSLYRDTLYAKGPVIAVKDQGKLTFYSRTKITNNFNNALPSETGILGKNYFPGGAIGVYKTQNATTKPIVLLGNRTELYNNLVVNGAGTAYNHGGGVYVADGSLQLGILTNGGELIKITNNYVVPNSLVYSVTERTTEGRLVSYYTFDTAASTLASHNMTRSNVFLTRTPLATADAVQQQMYDTKTDLITFNNELGAKTRVGVSKWFPGPTCRDTIGIARVAGAKQLYAATAYANKNFFDDSTKAFIFYHSTIGTYTIFFQRCATFKARNDDGVRTLGGEIVIAGAKPFSYHFNPDARCSGMLDSLQFKLQGGFYPYTYTWKCTPEAAHINWNSVSHVVRTRTSSRDNTISNVADAANASLRNKSSVDTCLLVDMVMSPSSTDTTYVYRVEGTDLTGNCRASKEVDIRMLRTQGDHYTSTMSERNGAWLHKNIDNITNPGVDSNLAVPVSDSTRTRFFRVAQGTKLTARVLPVREYGSIGIVSGGTTYDTLSVKNLIFCPGDTVILNTHLSDTNNGQFVMWDYDPQADSVGAVYTIPSLNSTVNAIYRPSLYWYHHVVAKPLSGYDVDYDGNVTISTEDGLAWLISTTNGLNFQAAQQFHNKVITIAAGTYDMSKYLWTPLGNINNPFSGTLNASGATIKGIVVNEPNIPYVGFFGSTDGATINNVSLTNEVLKGNNYVGGLVAMATNSTNVTNCTIVNSTPISGSYCVGALIGSAVNNVTVTGCSVGAADSNVYLLGNAVYAGGICGNASSLRAQNNVINIHTEKLQSALYQAGISANVNSTGGKKTPWWKRQAKTNGVSEIKNNYVYLTTSDRGMRSGGLVGDVSDADLENNYVYGEVIASNRAGSIAATVGDNVTIDRCFYVEGTSENAFGNSGITKSGVSNVTSFTGSGNRCITQTRVNGIDNVTRILNTWVWAQGDSSNYRTWRSDLLRTNMGYPIFGAPDIIPVVDTTFNVNCDTITWNGIPFTSDTVFHVNVVDSTLFIDSTMTFVFNVNHSEYAVYSDSVLGGQFYNGYGFNITAEELARLVGEGSRQDVRTFQFVDSLLTAKGCDSVVVLNLTVYVNQGIEEVQQFNVDVYPNPTRSSVTVSADGLQSVEIYDALSRLILEGQAVEGSCHFNLSHYSSGIYYLRIHTTHGTAVRKVIKK